MYTVYVAMFQSPADYYLRVMMREYQFEPASQMISVVEGDTVQVQVTGRRVEYRYAITWAPTTSLAETLHFVLCFWVYGFVCDFCISPLL